MNKFYNMNLYINKAFIFLISAYVTIYQLYHFLDGYMALSKFLSLLFPGFLVFIYVKMIILPS